MSEFDLLSLAADGMSAQRTMLDVAARNVAAAQASTPEHAYPRLVARFAGAQATSLPDGIPEPGGDAGLWSTGVSDDGGDDETTAGMAASSGDAGGRSRFVGTVRSGENADALTEMIAVLDAQRAYEANASIFDIGKRLAERTLTVGQS
jgi:flagellar basal-body rod protein FlgC